jgi:hypothetical protein
MGMVGTAVGLLITLIICVIIFYNIAGSTYHTPNYTGETTTQSALWNQSNNATATTISQTNTFFTIAPIIAIVIVAVVVIGYVQRIGG